MTPSVSTVCGSVKLRTKLPNRRAMLAQTEHQLRLARRLARPLSVLMIDIDHFKRINDRYGHAVGDEALRHVARLLSANVRAHDRAGRLGGEEFLVMLPDAGAEQADTIAERMRLGVAGTPCVTSAGPLALTISIGVACGNGHETLAQLLERADQALYAAKSAGRNVVTRAQSQRLVA